MPNDLSQRVLVAIRSDAGMSQLVVATGMDSVYDVLIGAAASLIQCERLFAAATSSGAEVSAAPYRTEQLFDDLRGAVIPGGVAWTHNTNFLNWAIGYFVNRAEHNIVAAFDKCLAAWQALKLGIAIGDEEAENIWMHVLPSARIRVLRFGMRRKSVVALLGELHKAFSEETAWDSGAAAAIKKITGVVCEQQSQSRDLASVFHCVSASGPDCLAIMWGRTNSFKHRIRGSKTFGLDDRDRLARLTVECAIAIKAFECLGQFWRSMMQEYKRSATKKALPG